MCTVQCTLIQICCWNGKTTTAEYQAELTLLSQLMKSDSVARDSCLCIFHVDS